MKKMRMRTRLASFGFQLSKSCRTIFPILLIFQTRGEILRLQCENYANFSVQEQNRKLASSFLTLDGFGRSECQYECTQNKRCKTVNTNDNEMLCELNDKSTEDRRDRVTTIAAPGWTYYSTSYNETLIGNNCIRMNPCKARFRCYDTCDCPGYRCKAPASCLELYYNGVSKNGLYEVDYGDGIPLHIMCDFESESNSIWTLITSFSLENRELFSRSFSQDAPQMEASPNWMQYRLGLQRMINIKSSSTLWRATCSFPRYSLDIYRDYMRARIHEIDILTYNSFGQCKNVDFIDIRGHTASTTTVPFWQRDGKALHTDSSLKYCQFDGSQGSVGSEDNFGHYHYTNSDFRCTESKNSTTQYWFGVVV